MSTRSFARNLFPPLDNLELTIRRRSRTDPTLLNDSEMAAKGNGDLPIPDLWTMKELCQPSLNVQNSCQFHGLSGDDANKHLDKFLHVTQSIKGNGVTDDALCLYLFPHSLTHHATAWFDCLPRNSINTFEQMAKMFLGRTFMKRRPEECYDLIKNMTAHQNDWDTSPQRSESSSSITSSSDTKIAALKSKMAEINKKSYESSSATVGNTQNVYATGAYQGLETLLGNTITNSKEELKGITTRSETAYQGPTIPTTSSSPPDLNFNISFVDALIMMPKFGPSIKSLLTNKDKLFELTRTPLNEHCSSVLLKKLPEKLRDPEKFIIPCDFPGMAECLALADLDASINLMPLSVWNKLSLPELTPTLMTLELADRSISRPIGVAEDVYVKVGKFHFPADFVVVDFNADPRAITFNLDQTSRYSANYNDMTARQIDVIDMAYEEYSQEVLGFFDGIASGNPTPYYDPIVSTTSSTLNPFGNSDFLLEEVDAFLALEDDPTSLEVDQSYVDTEGVPVP
nr:reverse transcriptase domain-containing protein [Tanacetum cinerariifolium]